MEKTEEVKKQDISANVVLIDETPETDLTLEFVKDIVFTGRYVKLEEDHFTFKRADDNKLVKVKNHLSIVKALNMIHFSTECLLKIECVGVDQFKITKIG